MLTEMKDDISERSQAHFATFRYVPPTERSCSECGGEEVTSKTIVHDTLGFVIVLTCRECKFQGYI